MKHKMKINFIQKSRWKTSRRSGVQAFNKFPAFYWTRKFITFQVEVLWVVTHYSVWAGCQSFGGPCCIMNLEYSPPWKPQMPLINVFTGPRHLFLSRVTWIQSTFAGPISYSSISILSSHLLLGLPNCLLSLSFLTRMPYAFICPMRTTYSTHLNFHYVINVIIFSKGYKLWSSSLCNCYFFCLRLKYYSHNFVLRHSPSIYLFP
jgi:hypothetical protein